MLASVAVAGGRGGVGDVHGDRDLVGVEHAGGGDGHVRAQVDRGDVVRGGVAGQGGDQQRGLTRGDDAWIQRELQRGHRARIRVRVQVGVDLTRRDLQKERYSYLISRVQLLNLANTDEETRAALLRQMLP